MADDIAALGITVNSTQVAKAGATLEDFRAIAQRTGETVEEVEKRWTAAAAASEKLIVAQNQAASSTSNQKKATDDLSVSQNKLNAANDNVTKSGLTQSQMFRVLAREVGLVNPQMAEMVRILGQLSRAHTSLGVAIAAPVLAIAAIAAGVTYAVVQFAKFEQQLSQFNNALILTKQSSGQTAQGLVDLAKGLAADGTTTVAEITKAEQALLQFKNVGGDAFNTVLELSKTVASAGFVDVASAAKTIAEALKDIPNASEKLTEANISLSASAQKTATDLFHQGQIMQAQRVILDDLKKSTAGISGDADTLSSAWNRLWGDGSTGIVGLGHWLSDLLNVKGFLNDIKGLIDDIIAKGNAIKNVFSSGSGSPLPGAGTSQPPAQTDAQRNAAAQEATYNKVTEALRQQGATAGMTAQQMQVYNETVAKGIPLTSAFGQAIAGQINAANAANETRQATDAIKQQTQALQVQANTVDMSAGGAAAYTAATNALNEARIKGIQLSAAQVEGISKEASALGAAAQAAAKAQAANQISRGQKGLFLSDTDVQIAEQLKQLYPDIGTALASSEASALRFQATMKQISDLTGTFINTFVQGLLQGKSVVDSLADSLKGLSQSLTQVASQQIGKSISGAASGGIESLIGGAAGAAAGAVGGPLATMAVGVGVGLLGNLLGQTDKAKQAADQAAQAFAGMTTEVNAFIAAANGPQGSVAQTLMNLKDQFLKLAQAALDAKQYAQAAALQQSYQAQINQILDKGLLSANDNLEKFAGEIKDVEDSANGLQSALTQMGMSASQAAQTVTDELNRALVQLGQDLTTFLTQQINSLQGNSFINDATNLASQVQQLQQDAATLGVSTALVDQFYVLSAQQIVDQNQLTGDSFQQLLQITGLTTDQLHEFNGAMSEVGRTAAQVAQTIQSYQDQLFTAQQDQSTLSGQLAVFDLNAVRAQQQEIANGGQALAALEALQAQQRLNIINQYNAQTLQNQQQAQQNLLDAQQAYNDAVLAAQQKMLEEQQRALTEATNYVQNAVNTINNYIQHVRATSGSPISNLQNAQGNFQQDLQLAASGNRNALDNITSTANDLITAITNYYGSSAQGQQMINQVLSQLSNLAGGLSPEEFIVNNITTSIDDQTSQLLAQLQAAQAAVDAQNQVVNTTYADQLAAVQSLVDPTTQTAASTDAMTAAAQQTATSTTATATSTAQTASSSPEVVQWLQNIDYNLRTQNAAWGQPTLAPIAYYNQGGWVGGPVGNDNVAAMLSAGEYVINSASAAANAGLVSAINASGGRPVVTGRGGAETADEVRGLRNSVERLLEKLGVISATGSQSILEALLAIETHAADQAKTARRNFTAKKSEAA